jgi:hypothetical protein
MAELKVSVKDKDSRLPVAIEVLRRVLFGESARMINDDGRRGVTLDPDMHSSNPIRLPMFGVYHYSMSSWS